MSVKCKNIILVDKYKMLKIHRNQEAVIVSSELVKDQIKILNIESTNA